ncbi:pyridoxamine 5'-phosphate oxidase family protein [Allosphingosinicella indica]|uniref:General stress protein 26 n=1 Tax=Allosphingosinicella indica TaxID=941907 RepID=A0A1X7FZV1_9SPHN|nr:pyridoxamine 5'-phosphate oxidase family protein [Allosphingosinicella indica]SMF61644.1 General stress protein 26 [Allosphingosinicella indica]
MTAHGNPDDVWALLKKQPVAMMTTEEAGQLVSRPMYSILRPDENRIYFITRLSSGKVGDIGGTARINLAYSDPGKSDYVSLAATASTSQDRAKLGELWSMSAEAWLPEGPDGADTALITVTPDEAKLWDANSSSLLYVVKMLAAVARQSPPDGGKVETVTM